MQIASLLARVIILLNLTRDTNMKQIFCHKFVYFIFLFLIICVDRSYAKTLHVNTQDGEVIYTLPNDNDDEKNGVRHYSPDLIIFKPYKRLANAIPDGETPASIGCIYQLTPTVPGCPKNRTSILPGGGSGAIALVDAGDNPFAESDLAIFSQHFGLRPCTTANGCFHKVFATGVQPPVLPDWVNEIVLDIEWSHAMAPNAQIFLVEAASEAEPDLFFANEVASALVQAAGGGQVSNSWSRHEFKDETQIDAHFQKPGVVFFGSSGDFSAGARYPSSSPFVISCGGTTIERDKNGNFVRETAWSKEAPNREGHSGGSGGPSIFEKRPLYQNSVQRIVGTARGTPDISFVANRRTGVLAYSTFVGGWHLAGGTSVSSPALAGIVNSANRRSPSTQEELSFIYGSAIKNYHSFWRDILIGTNGFPCLSGYDFVTGLGSPLTYNGK